MPNIHQTVEEVKIKQEEYVEEVNQEEEIQIGIKTEVAEDFEFVAIKKEEDSKIENKIYDDLADESYEEDVVSENFDNPGSSSTHSYIKEESLKDGKRSSSAKNVTGVQPYACHVCEKTFTALRYLKNHKLIHTDEKQNVCSVCSKAFTHIQSLKNHTRIHTGEKPYTCGVCNMAFTRSAHLKYHMSIHTGEKPYVCEICNKVFTQPSHLKPHMRMHTGERPHTCEICNKAFTRPNYLKDHMRIHTGVEPYTCGVCGKSFSTNGNLNVHKRIHKEMANKN